MKNKQDLLDLSKQVSKYIWLRNTGVGSDEQIDRSNCWEEIQRLSEVIEKQ